MLGGANDNTANHGHTPVPQDIGEEHMPFTQAAATADLAVGLTLTENHSLHPQRLPVDSGNPVPLSFDDVTANSGIYESTIALPIHQVCLGEEESPLCDVTNWQVEDLHRRMAASWSSDEDEMDFDFTGTSDRGRVEMNHLGGLDWLYHPTSIHQPLAPPENRVARHPSPTSPLLRQFPRLNLENGQVQDLGQVVEVGQAYGAVEAILPGNQYADAGGAANRTTYSPINGTLVGPGDYVLNSPTTPEDLVDDLRNQFSWVPDDH